MTMIESLQDVLQYAYLPPFLYDISSRPQASIQDLNHPNLLTSLAFLSPPFSLCKSAATSSSKFNGKLLVPPAAWHVMSWNFES